MHGEAVGDCVRSGRLGDVEAGSRGIDGVLGGLARSKGDRLVTALELFMGSAVVAGKAWLMQRSVAGKELDAA